MFAPVVIFLRSALNPDHLLTGRIPFRNHQDSPNTQLIQKFLGDFRSCSCNQDPVKGSIGGHPFIAVAIEIDGLVVERSECFLCFKEKLPLSFNGDIPGLPVPAERQSDNRIQFQPPGPSGDAVPPVTRSEMPRYRVVIWFVRLKWGRLYRCMKN